ncbi:hypothetical protein VTJ83DRAFT_3642 [Remersonia thermophila]|uniref:Long-chain-alcohol oxidase n=1 Tax=Remersonia thermophila TaxID=72144 RepID=A0ABR4DEP6_9PEZI
MSPPSPETASVAAPAPVSMPEADHVLNPSQWAVLMSVMDAIIPEIRKSDAADNTKTRNASTVSLSGADYSDAAIQLRNASSPLNPSSDLLSEYLAERPSNSPAFSQILRAVLATLPPDKQRGLRVILSLLNTRPGSLLLTSHATPLPALPVSDRIKILQAWSASSLWTIRGLFKSLTTLAKVAHIRSSTAFPALTGFPRVPADWTPGAASHPYEFLQFAVGAGTVEVTTDVAIIGSGCGAGVVANRLAREFGGDVRVLVLEKGRHFDAKHFPLDQATGLSSMFEAGGVIEADDSSINVTAGSVFGGGGTVNWSASLKTQDFVRKEWAEISGLPFFEGPEFQACLDRVWDAMGCDPDVVTPNHGNRVLLDGAKKLGYEAKIVPQNVGGKKHDCGYCTLGCWKGEKKGPVNGWFPEAAQKGAKFVERFLAERVIFEHKKGKRVAKGVQGVWKSESGEEVQVIVRAKKVVVSGGTLWSPVLLMNSGIKNPQLGRNLYLHPTNFVSGVFDEDVQPWEGGSLTSVVGSFDNLDSKGHGVKLEAMSMLPSFCLSFFPWSSGTDFKLSVAKYRHINTFIAICRDRDAGRIYRDPATGRPRIIYTPSDFDRAHNLRGMLELSRILFAQGAREIHPSVGGFAPFVRKSTGDEPSDAEKKEFETWLERLRAHGNKPPLTPFASAHQMGTCRMAAKAKDGVVDGQGRVWGTQGLYVADASVFPSASGVNPMVSVMALADWIAAALCEEIKAEEKGEGATAKL